MISMHLLLGLSLCKIEKFHQRTMLWCKLGYIDTCLSFFFWFYCNFYSSQFWMKYADIIIHKIINNITLLTSTSTQVSLYTLPNLRYVFQKTWMLVKFRSRLVHFRTQLHNRNELNLHFSAPKFISLVLAMRSVRENSYSFNFTDEYMYIYFSTAHLSLLAYTYTRQALALLLVGALLDSCVLYRFPAPATKFCTLWLQTFRGYVIKPTWYWII